MKLCECGCGTEVKNRFVSGHNSRCFGEETKQKMRNRVHTEETKRKLSEALKGKPSMRPPIIYTEEIRKRMSDSHKGKIPVNKGVIGVIKRSEEAKRKTSESLKQYYAEHKKVISAVTKEKISKANKGRKVWNEGVPVREETKEKIREKRKFQIITQVHKDRIQAGLLSAWENKSEEQRNNWVKNIRRSANIRPNKPETFLLNLLEEMYPGDYKYVGDGEIVIAGKCPDFININGQKKIIEHYGDYYHRNDDPQDRIALFAKYGYSTLIVWERELKDVESLKAKIREFTDTKI
jgi:hypothetical protein